ncbi:MAG: hypothetical protein EOO10_25055 [Chitinophagaceae bacterium]|nr:MAG: hypothetical protein EOO10_25055 [Chitinophagaceae bacterium]
MARALVVHDLIDKLPFHEALSWEKFQSFCTDLLYKRFDSIDSRDYLSKGNAQHGIDVYSVRKGEGKLSVAQCKLKEYIGPSEVQRIIGDFLKGKLVEETREFILCTSADLGRQQDEEQTIAKARKKLAERSIDFIVWDERGLSKELRTNATPEIINIVYRYFGEGIASNFYGEVWFNHIKSLRTVRKHRYNTSLDYIEREIHSYTEFPNSVKSTLWHGFDAPPKQTLIGLVEENTMKEGTKIVLLSAAGFGKTEELRQAAGHFSVDEKLLYPITFSLRDYEGQPIEEILETYDKDWKNIGEENILLLLVWLGEMRRMAPYQEESHS